MRKFYFILLGLLATISTLANPVTPNQARKTALTFLSKKGINVPEAQLNTPAGLVKHSQQSEAPYYVYNVDKSKGFVIVAGDDRVPSIIGYSDNGTFDATNLPENVAAFLARYEAQIKALGNGTAKAAEADSTNYEAVSPLIKTYWGQTSPYNITLPTVTIDSVTYDLYVGCVGVATAEVLGYYKYPQSTSAEIPAFTTPNAISGQKVTLPAIEGGTSIDWDNILNIYRGNETATQDTAVANLMKIAATAVKTQFSLNGAGAFTCDIPYALRTYFGYSNNIKYIYRRDYSQQEWNKTLYDEVANGRPVIIGAQSTAGGHEFVADGYDGEGLFHINWGWSGQCNGWFRLSLLDPGNNYDPTGNPTGSGYNEDQEAIIGIAPADSAEAAPLLKMDGTITDYSADKKNVQCTFYNMTGAAGSFDYGIGYVTKKGRIIVINSNSNRSFDRTYGDIYTGDVSALAVGTYDIHPVSRLHGQKAWVCDSDYVTAVIDKDHNVKFSKAESQLRASNFVYTGTKSAKVWQTVTATISNKGKDFYGNLYLFLSIEPYQPSGISDMVGVSVPANDSTKVNFRFLPYMQRHFYIYVATDQNCTNIIGSSSVDIADSLAAPKQLRVTASKVDFSTPAMTLGVRDVQGNWAQGSFTVRNDATKSFTGNLTAYLYMSSSVNGRYMGSGSYEEPVVLQSGESKTINFKFHTETGFYYIVALQYDDRSIISNTDRLHILGGEVTSGIDAVTAKPLVDDNAKVYTVGGIYVGKAADFESLPKGLYIINGKKFVK